MSKIINDDIFKSYKNLETFKQLKRFDKIDKLSDENKNKFIIKLFNDCYNYLDSIDINKNANIAIFISDKYLNYKAIGNFKEKFDTILNKLIVKNITEKYFDKILDFYQKTNNLMINHYCLFFIYKIIFLLYSYYCYYSNIHNNKDKLTIRYSDIINRFGIDFIGPNFDINRNINIFAVKNINCANKKYSHYKYNIFLSKILKYILILQNIYDKEPELNHYKNSYITIPQYMGNCWYISMLTVICYSDLSKKLLLSKIENETAKKQLIVSSKNKSDKIFIEMIDYIIKNITKKYKKYGDDIRTNCNDLIFLKEHVMNYIYQKYYELNSQNKLLGSINDFNGSNYYYYKALNDKINANENKEKINEVKILTTDIVKKYNIKVGANITYANIIINTLYNIFNIATLYLFDYIHSNNYLRQNNIEFDHDKSINSPDIIFIHKKEFKPLGNLKSMKKNKITKLDKETILYNNCKYKLDFILHSTDSSNSCPTCAHCISGIHYNGIEYYHDSEYSTVKINCDGNLVEIPCTLVQQKWVDDIDKAETFLKEQNYKDIKDICLFNIQKCFYKTTNITSRNLNKNIIYEDNLCFNNLYNLIYGYIKINDNKEKKEDKKEKKDDNKEKKEDKKEKKEDKKEEKKDDNKEKKDDKKEENKYKSSGVKIDIINKKKIIKRLIYLDKNKNKYVKLDKIYVLLSDLKYSGEFYYR